MKKKLIILSIFITILYLFNITYISNSGINVRFENIQIDDDITTNTSLVFFSDILFENKDNDKYLVESINKLNKLHPDIILFGGNLFNKSIDNYDEQTIKYITDSLKDINADKGKFAVLGNIDSINQDNKDKIINILVNANFQVLQNESILLNNNEFKFNLVGLNDCITSDIKEVNNTNNDLYTIVASNTPNSVDYYNNNYNYFISGNTLGGEIRVPLIGSINSYDHKYIYGKYYINDSILDITNGIGNINYDYRLFANREIVHYTIS